MGDEYRPGVQLGSSAASGSRRRCVERAAGTLSYEYAHLGNHWRHNGQIPTRMDI